eukprot:GHRR01037853.1.p1 GENE.GHRR01037853.1~~GHRR01037853.1.p1  ORF type:complete len:129 (-),score=20.24 GHRR01037853.1:216-602(-)
MDPQLKAWFDAIDTDRSGRLDAKELQRALALGNLNFGLNDVDQMVRAFDTSNARSLGYEEFQRLHIFLVNVQNSFQTFDRDRSGKLTPDEVTNALRQAGEHQAGLQQNRCSYQQQVLRLVYIHACNTL